MEMWEFFCELGSELSSDEWTFLNQFFKKVESLGTESITSDQALTFLSLYKKYTNEENIGSGSGGMA